MALSLYRQLTAIILLVAVLMAPLTSVAHSIETGMMEDTCTCHLSKNDCCHKSNDNHDEAPCDSTDDCCDEDSCHDSAEPPFMDTVNIAAPILKRFKPYSMQIPAKIFLAIFVPPES